MFINFLQKILQCAQRGIQNISNYQSTDIAIFIKKFEENLLYMLSSNLKTLIQIPNKSQKVFFKHKKIAIL